MYLVIKREKSEHLKHKVHELKQLACEVMECLEEAYSENKESDYRDRSRRDYRDDYNMRDDYDRDYRDEARGRGGRMRY